MYIEICNVTKTIKKAKVLDNISLQFEQGEIYGLRGKNGSGKTMLMRAILGLIIPSSGTININGKILGKDISFPQSVGALIEQPSFINNYSGFKNLKLVATILNKITDDQIRESIQTVGLDPDDKRKYKKYSLGMKQRLGIACAIMENPDLIVLDEPINALDENGIMLVREILHTHKKRGALIIVACHDKEELEFLSDEIYTMENGGIVDYKVVDKDAVDKEKYNEKE